MTGHYALLPGAVLCLGLVACGSTSTAPTAASGTPSPAGSASATPTGSAAPTATTSGGGTPVPSASASPKYPDQPSAATAAAGCGARTTPNAAVAGKPPKGFPVVTGWTPTTSVTQGSTVAVRGVVRGVPSAIVLIRDGAFAKVIKAGYRKTGSDQEPGFEADGDFQGPHMGNINVKTLCKGYLVVTYTFTS